MAQYFTKATDKSIEKFLSLSNDKEKNSVFDADIKPAFEKLIENLIYVYGFYSIDDVDTMKRECLTYLYEMLPKFDPTKGTKGFSYFNVVAKNWFVHKTRERNKKNKLESDLYYDLDHEVMKRDSTFSTSPYEDAIEEREYWISFYREMDTWKEHLTKKSEYQTLEAVIFLMRNPDLVTIYNKKAVYLYLRELTGLTTKQVVVNLKKIKELYTSWKNEWHSQNSGQSDLDDDDEEEQAG